MNIAQFEQSVSILTTRMTGFLLNIFDNANIEKAHGGLPAGAVADPRANLILATTCCTKPLFHAEMFKVAAVTGSDLLLMRHGLEPEETSVTVFDVIVHVDRHPCLLTDLVLYLDRHGSWWLVPSGNGAHIALEHDGLRLADRPPFLTWHERCDAVCRAAKQIKLAARPARAL